MALLATYGTLNKILAQKPKELVQKVADNAIYLTPGILVDYNNGSYPMFFAQRQLINLLKAVRQEFKPSLEQFLKYLLGNADIGYLKVKVWQINDDALWDDLDSYEGYMYVRCKNEQFLDLDTGQELRANIYLPMIVDITDGVYTPVKAKRLEQYANIPLLIWEEV